MKVKIIGGYHRGKLLDVQDNIMVVYLPEAFKAVFSVEDKAPTLTTHTPNTGTSSTRSTTILMMRWWVISFQRTGYTMRLNVC